MSEPHVPVPAIGAPPPDFVLRDQHGVDTRLSSFVGQAAVALVFVPAVFSPVCGRELDALRDDAALFARHGVEVLAISVDPVATLRAYADAEHFPFRLASDFWPHGAVAERFGAFDPVRGVATRTTVFVNNSGLVAATFGAPLGEARDHGEYRRALATL